MPHYPRFILVCVQWSVIWHHIISSAWTARSLSPRQSFLTCIGSWAKSKAPSQPPCYQNSQVLSIFATCHTLQQLGSHTPGSPIGCMSRSCQDDPSLCHIAKRSGWTRFYDRFLKKGRYVTVILCKYLYTEDEIMVYCTNLMLRLVYLRIESTQT